MKTKNTFVFNLEWAEALDGYGPEVEYAVYHAVVHYARTGEVLDIADPVARIAFRFIRRDLDRAQKRKAPVAPQPQEPAGEPRCALSKEVQDVTTDQVTPEDNNSAEQNEKMAATPKPDLKIEPAPEPAPKPAPKSMLKSAPVAPRYAHREAAGTACAAPVLQKSCYDADNDADNGSVSHPHRPRDATGRG